MGKHIEYENYFSLEDRTELDKILANLPIDQIAKVIRDYRSETPLYYFELPHSYSFFTNIHTFDIMVLCNPIVKQLEAITKKDFIMIFYKRNYNFTNLIFFFEDQNDCLLGKLTIDP